MDTVLQSLRTLCTSCTSLTGWRRTAVISLAGYASTFALPPWGILPVLPLGFIVLVWVLSGARDTRTIGWLVWIFATAHFIPALWWVSQSMITKGGPAVYMVPVAALGLPMALALFPAIIISLSLKLVRFKSLSTPPRLFLIAWAVALGWSTSELGRSILFTGFPWHLVGYMWIDILPVAKVISVFGVLALGFSTLLVSCLCASLLDQPRRTSVTLLSLLLITGTASVGSDLWQMTAPDTSQDKPKLTVRVVQPNVPQREKWRRDTRDQQIADLVRLSGAPGIEAVDLVVWPETAITFLPEQDPRLLQAMGILLEGSQTIVGGTVTIDQDEQGRITAFHNAMLIIDSHGEVVDSYRKRHLVPFGEYLPFRSVLAPLGLEAVAAESDFSVGKGDPLIQLPKVGAARILICYEAIFPQDLWTMTSRPDVFVVGTNDAWFGDTAGPQQHAAMSRARALEWGIPMVRAANTGVSLVADSYGQEVARIDVGQQGILTQVIPHKLSLYTVYTIWGDLPYLGILLVNWAALFMLFLRDNGLSPRAMRV